MILCHCHRVTDRQIKGCVRAGARNLREVAGACGASTRCGGCKRAVVETIEEAQREAGSSILPTLGAL